MKRMLWWGLLILAFGATAAVDALLFSKPDRMKLAGFQIVQVNNAPQSMPVVLSVKDCSNVAQKQRRLITRYDWQASECRNEPNVFEQRISELPRKSNIIAIARWRCHDCFGYKVRHVTVFPSALGDPVVVNLDNPVTIRGNQQFEVSFNLIDPQVFKIPEAN